MDIQGGLKVGTGPTVTYNNKSDMFETADQSLLNNNRHILLKFYTRKKRRETINYVYVTVDLIVGDPVL